MKALLLAEKPSVMRAIQEVYQKEGHPDQIDFGAFHGHLMELKDPEMYESSWADRTDNSILPMIPKAFEYYPREQDQDSVEKLMTKIRTGNYDYLINACDAGREGEHIFWSFYETEGLTLPVKRFWASSVTKPAIKRALGDLKDASLYDGMRQAAKFRAQFDWLVGMNFTRAASNKLGRFAGIGRVQSPTLKIIVDKEIEIQNFVPQKFYEAKVDFELNGKDVSTVYVLPDGKNTRTDKATADTVVKRAKAAKSGVVKDIKEVIKDTDAPTLYSLTELQKDANKYLKYSADRTLAIAQKLYEGGLLTYPRTESRFLPTDMIPEISQHLAPIQEVPELAKIASGIGQPQIDAMLKKNYINDAGITDHHAIIPTDQKPNFSALSKEEQALYTLVCKSFLAIFLPPYKVATSTVIVAVGNDMFKGQGRRVIDPGYSVLYQTKAEKEVLIPACKKGDPAIYKKGKVAEGTTKPPQRYSPRTILSAMMNAGQDPPLPDSAMRSILKDVSGLGTPATRSDILKKLEIHKYVELKDNMYYATNSGISLIKAIGDRTFCSPLLTAQWEQKLLGMEEGKYAGNFRSEMIQYIQDETKYLIDTLTTQRQVVGKCPICGGDIVETERSWRCKNVRQGDPSSCQFVLSKLVGGATMTTQDVESLISTGTTRIFTIKTKDGENVDVNFVLNKAEKRIALMYANNDHVIGKCPFCGSDIVSTNKGWFCSSRRGNKEACSFAIGKVIGGTTLTDDDIISLLKNKETREFQVITKDKRTPLAKFILSETDRTVSLAYIQKEIGKCPFCGGTVKDLGNAWACENNSKDRDNKCGFWLARKLRGASVPEQAIVSLMNGNQTDPFLIPSNDGKRKVKVFLVPDPQTKQVKLRALVDKIGTCPRCGKPVLVGDKSMFCSGRNDKSCEFSVARVVKGATLSDADFVALLNGQRTSEHKFQWNNGKTGSAKLYLQGSELKFEFLQ